MVPPDGQVSDCGALILSSCFCGQIIGVVRHLVQLLLASIRRAFCRRSLRGSPAPTALGRREARALTAKYAKAAVAAIAGARGGWGARLPPEGGVPAAVAAVPWA